MREGIALSRQPRNRRSPTVYSLAGSLSVGPSMRLCGQPICCPRAFVRLSENNAASGQSGKKPVVCVESRKLGDHRRSLPRRAPFERPAGHREIKRNLRPRACAREQPRSGASLRLHIQAGGIALRRACVTPALSVSRSPGALAMTSTSTAAKAGEICPMIPRPRSMDCSTA